MYYSTGLEYLVSSYKSPSYSPNISYFSKFTDDNYSPEMQPAIISGTAYSWKNNQSHYGINSKPYHTTYSSNHSFTPELFLNPIRPRARFIDDSTEVRKIAEQIFELMLKQKMPDEVSINVLPFEEFKDAHSKFGRWNNGILGFSINGEVKKVFVRENHLDMLLLVIAHEIGHVISESLLNAHDEEAKAFAFAFEWAKTIKQHNLENLGQNIKDEIDFQPARNGLHDVAFSFVDFMVKKGIKAIDLHRDLAKKYVSVFNKCY